MGEKLLPFRAMAIPIRLTDASTNVSRHGLDASYMALYNHCATERQLLFCMSVKKTRPDYQDVQIVERCSIVPKSLNICEGDAKLRLVNISSIYKGFNSPAYCVGTALENHTHHRNGEPELTLCSLKTSWVFNVLHRR